VKRKDLIKKCSQIARSNGHDLVLHREGGSHTVYRINGRNVVIPRHNEIPEPTARTIITGATEAAKKG